MKSLSQKLVLGTVQLGIAYGINNSGGKPSREEALKILSFAYESGINIFDTANAYGKAENILGTFCKKYDLCGKIKIITKIKDPQELNKSLERLKMDYVDGCLLHEPKDMRNKKIIDSLKKIKKSGLVKNIGVSVYEPEDAVYAVKSADIDYIQIPYNIFDQRLDKTNFFELAEKNNKKVFARSVFLQGLFFMPNKEIPSSIKNAVNYLDELDKIIVKYGLSRRQIAMQFALKNKNIDYVVFGVDNIKQLKENIDIANHNINCDDCIKEIKNKFINVEKNIISPDLWKIKKQSG